MRAILWGIGSSTVPACALLLAAVLLLLLAGCTILTSSGGAVPAQAPSGIQSRIVHVSGEDRGVLILVGRSTCPWCMKDKSLLTNLSVDYFWIDLDSLNETETAVVMDSIRVCGQMNELPVLVINGQRCIIGYQEAKIREALG